MMRPKESLGKGLGALFPDLLSDIPLRPAYVVCGIEELYPNPFQPRRSFDDAEQRRLEASIRKAGIIQPIVVRKTDKGFEIIAGERRWRAAQGAGLKEVPIVIRDASDMDVAELSLVENLLRNDLNPLEEAQAYENLVGRFGFTQDDVAERVGKDRSTIANTLRLLKLPAEVQKAIRDRSLSAGHARALLALSSDKNQLAVFRRIIQDGLSVRAAEKLVKVHDRRAASQNSKRRDSHLAEWEDALSRRYLTPVRISQLRGKGTIRIRFHSREDLDRILGILLDGSS